MVMRYVLLILPCRMVVPATLRSSSDYSRMLTFNTLLTSHAGTYTCTAMVGSAVETESVNVTVQSECALEVLSVKFDRLSVWLVVEMSTTYYAFLIELSPSPYYHYSAVILPL